MRAASHNVSRWIRDWADEAGQRPAVADAWRRLDYAALEDRCARAAGHLARAGVARGDRVALLLGNRSATLEVTFAAARLGAMAVPINTRLAAPEVSALLDDCRPRLLLHEHSLADLAQTAVSRCRRARPETLPVGDPSASYEAALAAARPHHDVLPVSPEEPMILMYTSGTTGTPKGALLPHRKTLANSRNAQRFFQIQPDDRVLVVVPLFHSFGLQILSIPALHAGASLVLQPHFDPAEVWRAVAEERIRYLGGVPTMFRPLLEALDAVAPDVSSLRFLFTAGAAIPVELIHAFEARGLRLKQGFGQTETSILCCLDAADAVRKAGSVGRPVEHCELRIVREASLRAPSDAWEDCACDETGEIVVRGPITMLGYWEQPEASAETLREGWLLTGDQGAFDAEGFVTLRGRSKDMYISGGENVYPRQVEATYEEHPDVRELAVLGTPHPRWGEVGRAYVVLAPQAELDPEALIAWGRERLATFKVPASFVAVEALPKTETGKVQKFRLHELEAGDPQPSASTNAAATRSGTSSDSSG
jgi:fatty-acyl-CoA synthase